MLRVAEEVAAALAAGRPVVALESTIIAHGLPRPDNLRVAREIEDAVRGGGRRAGHDRRARRRGARRARRRGARGDRPGATASTSSAVRDLGARARERAGGRHHRGRHGPRRRARRHRGLRHRRPRRRPPRRVGQLRRVGRPRSRWPRAPIVVVCAGVKSILDVGATLERLETLVRPGARLPDRPPRRLLPQRLRATRCRGGSTRPARSPRSSAPAASSRLPQALVVANPLPADQQMDPALHDRVLAEALARPPRPRACGQGGHALRARALPRRDRRRERCAANVRARAAQRGAGRAHRRGRRELTRPVVVVGDVMRRRLGARSPRPPRPAATPRPSSRSRPAAAAPTRRRGWPGWGARRLRRLRRRRRRRPRGAPGRWPRRGSTPGWRSPGRRPAPAW